MNEKGYCWASWQPEVLALSTALHSAEGVCIINVSVSTPGKIEPWIETLAPQLLALKADIDLALVKGA
jgi:hypothetical protein